MHSRMHAYVMHRSAQARPGAVSSAVFLFLFNPWAFDGSWGQVAPSPLCQVVQGLAKPRPVPVPNPRGGASRRKRFASALLVVRGCSCALLTLLLPFVLQHSSRAVQCSLQRRPSTLQRSVAEALKRQSEPAHGPLMRRKRKRNSRRYLIGLI